MDVTLRPELEKIIEDEVKSGRSSDPSEFLSNAVVHYVLARDLGETYTTDEINQMISEGLHDIEQGHVVDGEAALRQLLARSLELRKPRA